MSPSILVDGGVRRPGPRIDSLLAARVGTLTHPLFWWQFLTYGFVHVASPGHIIGNMLGLWFLGRDIEDLYGRAEFYRLYLAMVVVGGVVWAAVNKISDPSSPPAVGASAAVAGIVVLYALNFPRRTMLLFFVLPIPAWVLGVALVAGDILGATGQAKGTSLTPPTWGARASRSSIIGSGGTSAVFFRGNSAGRGCRVASVRASTSPRRTTAARTTPCARRRWIESWRRSTARAKAV